MSLHEFLNKAHWNFFELKLFLEKDASTINQINHCQVSPLHRVLLDEKCSPDIIKLFLQHGADANLIFSDGHSQLQMLLLLLCDKNGAINAELLQLLVGKCKGFDLNKVNELGMSLLCYALSHPRARDV